MVCLSYMNILAPEIQPSLSETRPVLDKMLNILAEIFFFLLCKWVTNAGFVKTRQPFWLQLVAETWMENKQRISQPFHLRLLCFHDTHLCDMKQKPAWAELTDGCGSMWQNDDSLSSLACYAPVCQCVCAFVRMFTTVCTCEWIQLGSSFHLLCPVTPTSIFFTESQSHTQFSLRSQPL